MEEVQPQPQSRVLGTQVVTEESWSLPPWRHLKRPKEVLPLAGTPSTCDAVSVSLLLTPINSAEPPPWGRSVCSCSSPIPCLHYLPHMGVVSPGSLDPLSGLGLIDWWLHSSVQHKDTHIQALSLSLLMSEIHSLIWSLICRYLLPILCQTLF